jgi:glycosyltransferase involved in cell wall biosynthesis
MTRPTILITGPHRDAVSGISTHVNLLLGTHLAEDFELVHFQVGSEGRSESGPARIARLLASPFTLFATILFRHVVVVHLNTSLTRRGYWRDLAYLIVAKLLRARVIWQVHGGMLPRVFFGNRRIATAFLRWTLGLPDLVAVLARSELAAYTEFLPHQAVMVMPNGIDMRAFARVPTMRPYARRPLRLVYIGRLAREKGLYEALQGVRIAIELGVDAHLTMVGSGPEAAALERYSHALGLSTRVAFHGPMFGDAKVKMLATADVAILPSYAEGLPYSLLEAMAAAVPVLATSVGAIPDVMTHGIHGLLVPPRDATAIAEALAELVRDRERLSWMSRACRRRVLAAYSIERLAAELSLHYHALAGGSALRMAGPGMVDIERRSAPRPARTAPVFSRPRQ